MENLIKEAQDAILKHAIQFPDKVESFKVFHKNVADKFAEENITVMDFKLKFKLRKENR